MKTRARRIWPAAVLAGGVVLTAAWTMPTSASSESRPAAQAEDEPAAPSGGFLYRRDCAVCHGQDGTGTYRGPSLTGVGTASVDFFLRTDRMPITGPTKGLFRPTPPEYSEAEIEAIVEYLAPIVEGGPDIPRVPPEAGDVADGGSAYRTHCAGCHGTAGVGGALVFSNKSSPALGTTTRRITAEAILVGPGTMPVMHPAPLDDEDLLDVVAYVDEVMNDPPDPGGWHLWHLGPVPEGAVAWGLGLGVLLLVARWIGSTVREHREHEGEGLADKEPIA